MASATLKRMDWRHLWAVSAIEDATFPAPWSFGVFASELGELESDWFVAIEDGQVTGYVGLKQQGGVGHLMNIAVRADRRGRGIGRSLMTQAFDAARLRSLASVTLEVRASNLDAQRFYAKHGFVAVGRRRAYYTDSGEDAVLMTAKTPAGAAL